MTRFDQALSETLRVCREHLGEAALKDATVIRDATGRLTVVLRKDGPPVEEAAAVALDAALGAYSPGPTNVILRPSDLIDPDDILKSPDRVAIDDGVFLVDRLLTNQDWLRAPLQATPRIPLATGFSIKGGVGRTTALAVWAWHLARLGKNVIVVDLDLEAPGMGTLLLAELPALGLVDWLAEDLVGQSALVGLDEILATSPIGEGTPGSVRVLPAYGTTTQDYVPKLGRVLLPGLSAVGEPQGFAHRLVRLLDRLGAADLPPDAILLDARAGLHDLGAAAVTQLGAEVFLFNRDEPSGWEAYRQLFGHLHLSRAIHFGTPDEDLRLRLKMVAAQSEVTEGAIHQHVERSFDLWTSLYDQEPDPDDEPPVAQPGAFARDDTDAPHFPTPIFFDSKVRGLQLVNPDDRPAWELIDSTFGRFLEVATRRLLGSPHDP